ncbi:putative ribonuclease H-like domain-containing protein [Tanacetum coccineum]
MTGVSRKTNREFTGCDKKDDEGVCKESGITDQEKPENSTQGVNTARPSINTEPDMFSLGDNATLEPTPADFFGDETKVDMSNITTTYPILSTLNTRIHKDHSLDHVIGDVYKNKKDERGTVVRNKARMVAQGHTQEDRIDYDEIEKEVYICQPPGFEDPDVPNRVYKVENALYGLHQAPKAWYETLSTKKELCTEFKTIDAQEDQMSLLWVELTFFLGLQVMQKEDGIFISQDKYVDEILKKFGFSTVRISSTPIETSKPLLKDAQGLDRISTTGESSVRRDLHFNDEDGITCLTNTEIFENLQLMGYEKLSDKLTFYKSFFSPQWKYLIHTILQCLSSKSTAWNEFGTNIASAVICLAKKQKFNFSKLIFDGMLRNLDPNSKKFLMYPRFLQLFLNNQIENLTAVFNDEYDTPSHTKKVFANMRRQGKDFSGTVTPLFATMLIQSQAVEGEGSGQPTEPQHTPTTASPSHVEPIPIVASSSQPKKTQKQRKTKRKATEISQSSGPTTLVADETVHEENGHSVERATTTATSLDAEQGSGNINITQSMAIPNDPFPQVISSGGSPRCQEALGDTIAQTRSERLKKRVKKLESKKNSRTPQLKRRLFKVRIEYSVEKSLGDQEDSSKQGRNKIAQDEGISWFQEGSETQGRYGYDIGVNIASTSITAGSINITTAEPVTTASALVTTAGVSVSTAKPSTPPPTTTTPIEDEHLTISQTLMKMKSEKSKAKGVTMQEPSESGTRVRVPPSQIDPKDKGKEKMVEPEKPKKKKDQIEYDDDVAQRL